MSDQCNRCQFWLEDKAEHDPNDPDWGFGRCRRQPPRVSEAYVTALMPKLEYGQQADPEIGTVQMTTASLFPATCSSDWCGAYVPIQPADQIAAWVDEYERTRAAIDAPTREDTPDFELLSARMNHLEGAVVAAPAITREGVIAKLFMIARINGDGASPDAGQVAHAVKEAQSLLFPPSRED
jgi:hypothetical protein